MQPFKNLYLKEDFVGTALARIFLWKQIYYLCLLLIFVSIWWEPDQSWSIELNWRLYIQL